jgi:hypothetical protein
MLLLFQAVQGISTPRASVGGGWVSSRSKKSVFRRPIEEEVGERIEQVIEDAAEAQKAPTQVRKQVAAILQREDYTASFIDAYMQEYQRLLKQRQEEEDEAISILLLH